RDADVVLESGPSARHRFTNQVLYNRAALGPELALIACFAELAGASRVSNHQSAKAGVANEDVGAESQYEVGYTGFSGGDQGIGECRRGRCVVEQIGWSADAKRGVRRDRLMAPKKRAVQTGGETFDRREIRTGHGRE